jgi:hypothetical protein
MDGQHSSSPAALFRPVVISLKCQNASIGIRSEIVEYVWFTLMDSSVLLFKCSKDGPWCPVGESLTSSTKSVRSKKPIPNLTYKELPTILREFRPPWGRCQYLRVRPAQPNHMIDSDCAALGKEINEDNLRFSPPLMLGSHPQSLLFPPKPQGVDLCLELARFCPSFF